MAIWIGLDEAGYGPRLGPLTIGLFAIEGAKFDVNIWEKAKISDDPRDWKQEMVVCDSKELYKSQSGIKRLELNALSLLPRTAVNFSDFLRITGDFIPNEIVRYPWYKPEFSLPVNSDVDLIKERQELFKNKLKKKKLKVHATVVRPVLERQFNSLLKMHNKSRLEFEVIMKLLEKVIAQHFDETFYIDIDKLGGRDRYADLLAAYFPMQEICIISENRHRSVYEIPDKKIHIRFSKQADKNSFPVAAASILAKYTRELFMKNLNNYWTSRIDGLQPTAGYPEDAKRYMYVVKPHLEAAGYNEGWMVREK